MKHLLLIALLFVTGIANSQEFLGQPESALKNKTSLQKKTAANRVRTYTMTEGTRTFVYYINRATGRADGLTVKFTTASDRTKYLNTLVDGKKWQYTDTAHLGFRGQLSKDLQVGAYVQKNHPQSKAGAVVFSVAQTPVRQKKLSNN